MRVYDAAKLGLKGDSLALAAGMRPEDFYRLCEMDELVELAIKKARADSEMGAARTLYRAADEGDAKAALEILRHQHDWTAKQAVSVEVNQTISIIGALQEAENRVINMGIIDEAPTSGNSPGLLTNDEGASNGYPDFNRRASADAPKLRR